MLFGVIPAWSQAPTFHPCATDPTYAQLEKLQYNVYKLHPGLFKQINATDENKSTAQPRGIGDQTLPTCYQDPVIYSLLADYLDEIQKASGELGFHADVPPAFGSLPTDDLNAYTYPASASHGSVIIFNDQLFIFAYEMAAVTLRTLSIKLDPNSKQLHMTSSQNRVVRQIRSDVDLREEFVMDLIQFVLLTPPNPPSFKNDELILSTGVASTMEMFAVGHEYGHVIKRHTSPTATLRLEPDRNFQGSPVTLPILARSWTQEFEADQIGLQLLIQALKDEARRTGDNELWLDKLYGALFFFKCLELIDGTQYALNNGVPPPVPSIDEQVYLRSIADGTVSDEQRVKFANVTLADHPPAWLRAERVRESIDSFLAQAATEDAAVKNYTTIVLGMINNLDLLWNEVLPEIPPIIKAMAEYSANQDASASVSSWRAGWETARKRLRSGEQNESQDIDKSPRQVTSTWKPRPGCTVSPASWSDTFLCNPMLQQAISNFRNGSVSDERAIQLYRNAVERDWLLLSGYQVSIAEQVLKNGETEARPLALAILALSGDRRSLSVLTSVNLADWSESERLLSEKARRFLEHYGRDTSVVTSDRKGPMLLRQTDLLCYPAPLEQVVAIDRLIPKTPKNVIRESLLWSIWADLLLRTGRVEAALAYAPTVPLFGGNPNPDLESQVRARALEHDKTGWVLAEEHRYDAAIGEFRKAIQAAPDYPDAHRNLCKALNVKGERQEAIAECRTAVKQLYADVHIYLGERFDKNGDHSAAIPEYDDANRADPGNARTHFELGVDLAIEGDYQGAVDELREVVRLGPNNANAHKILGDALAQSGRQDEALSEYREAARIAPNDASLHTLIGTKLEAKGQKEDALREYRIAVQIDPNDGDAHQFLGSLFLGQEQYEQAVAEFRAALRFKPDDATAHALFAVALHYTGMDKEALAEAQKAHDLDSTNQEIRKIYDVIVGPTH